MPRWLTGIAVLAALVLLAASATMNYLFASSLGRTPAEGIVLGVVSVGVDILKAVVAIALGYAARERRWGFFCVGGLCFALFTALSLTTALGFTASNRGGVTAERERQNSKLTAIEARIGEVRIKLKALPAHRPLSLIDESLAVARSDTRWTTTRQCSAPAPSMREFCDGVGRLRTERVAALEAGRLDQVLAALEADAERLRDAGSGLVSDPQATALARSIGLDESQVQRVLMVLLGLAVEVGSGLGAYLALGHGLGAQPRKSSERSPQLVPARAVEAPAAVPSPAAEPTPSVKAPRPGVLISVRPPTRPTRRNGTRPLPESS